MKVTLDENDINETRMVAGLMNNIDNLDIVSAEKITDEIYLRQPFFLMALLGLHFDISKVELEEIIKIYLLIWEYFKNNPKVQRVKITEKAFVDRCLKNAHMFNYAEGEQDNHVKKEIYTNDLLRIKSKTLLAMILLRFNTRPFILEMNSEIKVMIMVGIKSFIECFEAL